MYLLIAILKGAIRLIKTNQSDALFSTMQSTRIFIYYKHHIAQNFVPQKRGKCSCYLSSKNINPSRSNKVGPAFLKSGSRLAGFGPNGADSEIGLGRRTYRVGGGHPELIVPCSCSSSIFKSCVCILKIEMKSISILSSRRKLSS